MNSLLQCMYVKRYENVLDVNWETEYAEELAERLMLALVAQDQF